MRNAVPKIQELFTSMHSVLGLYLTNKCNMSCRHCSVLSGPDQTSLLNVDAILGSLRQFALLPEAKGIHISGGEPFLYPRDVAKIADVGRSYGLAVAVATNASWATKPDKARSALAKVPGLTQLLLSTDVFHQEFAPIERVAFAAKAGVDIGLHVTINICSELDAPPDTLILDRLLDDHREHVDIAVSQIERAGRGASLEVANWRGVSDAYPQGGCLQINRPVILENGRLLACCNTTVAEAARNGPLDGGDVGSQALSKLLARLRDDNVIVLIRCFGPAFFAERLSATAKAQLCGMYAEGDICGLCKNLMSKSELVDEIRSIASSEEGTTLAMVARNIIAQRQDSTARPEPQARLRPSIEL